MDKAESSEKLPGLLPGAIRERGETPFSIAGEGVVLCYFNSDLKLIQAKYGRSWFQNMVETFMRGDPDVEFILDMVAFGAKKDRKKIEVPEELLDKIPIHDLGDVVFDAACISQKGMTAQEYISEVMQQISDVQAGNTLPNPPRPDTTSTTISAESASGPASA